MMYDVKFTKRELEVIQEFLSCIEYTNEGYYKKYAVDSVLEKVNKINKEFRLFGEWRIPFGKKDK